MICYYFKVYGYKYGTYCVRMVFYPYLMTIYGIRNRQITGAGGMAQAEVS